MNLLRSKNGSSSVLIIMLLVVLMMFGLAIVSTSLSNKSLSDRKHTWMDDYYTLESNVALKLAEIDHKIQEVKEQALAEPLSNENRDKYYKELLKDSFDEILIFDDLYYLPFTVSDEQEDYKKHISVELNFVIPHNSLNDDQFLSALNYQIVLYNEIQDLFEYDDIEFGVPYAPGDN